MGFAGEPGIENATGAPAKDQKFAWEEHRDIMEASVRTSTRPG